MKDYCSPVLKRMLHGSLWFYRSNVIQRGISFVAPFLVVGEFVSDRGCSVCVVPRYCERRFSSKLFHHIRSIIIQLPVRSEQLQLRSVGTVA